MTKQRIEPHKVTKPIQLLAAWLVGLVLTNCIFLGSAIQISQGSWERSALVIAAIVNVPLFLLALFVLQTRFRAELQEDTFYSEYLSKKTSMLVRVDKNAVQDAKIEELERSLSELVTPETPPFFDLQPVAEPAKKQAMRPPLNWSKWPIALNALHPNFSEIREALRSAGIPLADFFGEDSKGPPVKWIIALNQHLPFSHKAYLLKTIAGKGFDGFHFWEPLRDAGENEDVYIGSYGIDSYTKITDEFLKLLSGSMDPADLNHYYSKNRVR